MIRRRPIFPGRHQPGIVGTGELNCCVRDGNRCGLSVISTGMAEERTAVSHAPSKLYRAGRGMRDREASQSERAG